MFSFEPSYYTPSPFDSYYSQSDARRRAIIQQRQREIEALRWEEARKEQARAIEARQLEALRQHQHEQRLRDLYSQQIRNRQRVSRYEDVGDQGDELSYYNHPFMPHSRLRPSTPAHNAPTAAHRPPSESRTPTPILATPLSPRMTSSPVDSESMPDVQSTSSHPLSARAALARASSSTEAEHKAMEHRRLRAATRIQSHWRSYTIRRRALDRIAALRSDFAELQSGFVYPSTVDFLEGSSTPTLAFTAQNKPILAFEHAATKLLTQVDAVDSTGDTIIRAARKALVNEIEEALRVLEAKKVEAWKARPSAADIAASDSAEHPLPPSSPQSPTRSSTGLPILTDASANHTTMIGTEETPMASSTVDDVDMKSDSGHDGEKLDFDDQDDDEAWVDALDELQEIEDASTVASQVDPKAEGGVHDRL